MKPIEPYVMVGAVVGIAIYFAVRNFREWVDEDAVGKSAFAALGVFVVACLCLGAWAFGFAIAGLIGDRSSQVWHKIWHGKMVAMRNSDAQHGVYAGSLFMVVGFVGPTQVYYYYTARPDGGLTPHQWDADQDCIIYEEDRQDGDVIQYDMRLRDSWLEWIALPGHRLAMDFHIPKGSLKKEFSIK
jgi:hypothetical protein